MTFVPICPSRGRIVRSPCLFFFLYVIFKTNYYYCYKFLGYLMTIIASRNACVLDMFREIKF